MSKLQTQPASEFRPIGFARVLLADDNPTSRLTLQTVLEAGGYRVDSAASSMEACTLLDESEYALVLTDLSLEAPDSGLMVLAHARSKPYKPATAIVTTSHGIPSDRPASAEILIGAEDLPELLSKIAGLISARASRRIARALRQAS